MIESLSVCEHGVPTKFKTCGKCYVGLSRNPSECSHQFSIALLSDKINTMSLEMADLKHRLNYYENIMVSVGRIKFDAEEALETFVKKAHELKQIDAKRDDVINLLFEKIAKLEG